MTHDKNFFKIMLNKSLGMILYPADDKQTVNNNYNSNTVVKQGFAVVKPVDGRAALVTCDNID